MSLHRAFAPLLLVILAFTLAACGGGAGGSTSGTADGHSAGEHAQEESVQAPVDGAPEVTLTAVDIDYEPQRLELQAGEPTNVTVVNEGEALHDFTLEEADVHLNVEPGKEATTSVKLAEPGEYQAICTVPGHADAGMVVDVTVTE